MSNKENILRLENVTMQFGGVVAVNNLSLEVNKGEIVALIGPNGAGKTTAFNCITGVYQPTNGLVEFMGSPIMEGMPTGKMAKMYAGENSARYTRIISHTPDEITKAGIARTFQNIRLFKGQSVFDNVLIAKHMRAKQNPITATFMLNYKEEKRMRDETWELLREQGLDKFADYEAGSLSYGMQRRLEIARALATSPKLLCLDEPAAGMNPQETDELAEFITKIRTQYDLTILLIEHHMNLVLGISDRIYCIDFGKLISSGLPLEVANDAKVVEAYLGVQDEEDLDA
ncbi:MAG: ABC transporter ATP-binding protein [Lachnospiraceae bacterium]|nr:ABC transporter ATP-binding protein [Lachnospiraceae bacterium]